MERLNKHILKFDLAYNYFMSRLDGANTLSIEVQSSVDFKKGQFFTLLPVEANLERLYEFEAGIVLPQNPIKKFTDSESTYSEIPSVAFDIALFLFHQIESSSNLSIIVDDVLRRVSDKKYGEPFSTHGMYFGEEIYYLIKKDNASTELIYECLLKSNAFWHSLGVLTESYFDSQVDKKVSLEKIREIVTKVKLIFNGAYDGEGYVFWEPLKERRNNLGKDNF